MGEFVRQREKEEQCSPADLSEPHFTQRDKLDDSTVLARKDHPGSPLEVASYRRDAAGLDNSTANAACDSFMVVVCLRSAPAHNRWRNGRHEAVPCLHPGTLAILDLRESWVAELNYPFHSVHFLVPQLAFDRLTDELGTSRVQTLYCPDTTAVDPVMHSLAQAMLPLAPKPKEATALFTDHVVSAALLHLATNYGQVDVRDGRDPTGLPSGQVKRAIELMSGDLKSDIGIVDLAAACNLSVRHFQRAFQQATGLPPHRWRLQQRVDRAKQLLECTAFPLVDIALTCGFADQSHLTRVFSKGVGISPALYRRARQ